MYLAENQWGYALIDYIKVCEKEMTQNELYRPITGSLILANLNEKYLIAYNKWRKQWELPAGGIEPGESPRECVERELFEETNQKAENIVFKGLFKLHDKRKNIIKYQAMYFGHIDKLQIFNDNEEMDKIMLWDLETDIGEFDAVDRKMIELCLRDETI